MTLIRGENRTLINSGRTPTRELIKVGNTTLIMGGNMTLTRDTLYMKECAGNKLDILVSEMSLVDVENRDSRGSETSQS